MIGHLDKSIYHHCNIVNIPYLSYFAILDQSAQFGNRDKMIEYKPRSAQKMGIRYNYRLTDVAVS